MAAPDLTELPANIIAGDSLIFTKSFADYPAADWTLIYYLQFLDGSSSFSFPTTPSGNSFSINVPGSQTQAWTAPGNYSVQAQATAIVGGAVHTIWQGTLDVMPGFAQAGDYRSINRKIRDNLRLVMQGRANDDILDSVVEGTAIRRLPVDQLIPLLDRYEAIVKKEEAQAKLLDGKATGRTIYARFTAPNVNWNPLITGRLG